MASRRTAPQGPQGTENMDTSQEGFQKQSMGGGMGMKPMPPSRPPAPMGGVMPFQPMQGPSPVAMTAAHRQYGGNPFGEGPDIGAMIQALLKGQQ